MAHVETQLAALNASLTAGFAAMDRQLARLEAKVDQINGKVARAHERISEHDGILAGHGEDLGRVRTRAHELANRMQEVIATQEGIGPNRRVTQRDVRLVVVGGGFMVAAWQFIEWAMGRVQGP